MRDEMKATKDEMQRLWRGLTYHCSELTTFMAEHGRDDYFKTDEGKEMMSNAMKLMLAHVNGLLTIDGELFETKVDDLTDAFDDLFTKSFKEV